MYQALTTNEEAFERLSGLRVNEFEALYRDFATVWRKIEAERLSYAGRLAVTGAGRKFAINQRDQLLSVLIWSRIGLHPKSISKLLDVHVTTFARTRQRVLRVLTRLDMTIEIPDRKAYKEIEELSETYPELLQLSRQ